MTEAKNNHSFLKLDQQFTRRQWAVLALLAALTLGMSAMLWWNYRVVLALPVSKLLSAGAVSTMVAVLIAFCATLTMIAMLGLLARPALAGVVLILFAAGLPIVFFAPLPTTFMGILVLFLAYCQYYVHVRRESGLRRKFSVIKNIHYGMTGCIALSLIALSLLFFGTTAREGSRTISSAETIADFSGAAVNQFLSVKVPAFNPRESLDDFFYSVLSEYMKNGALPPAPKDAIASFDITNPGSSIEQLVSADLYPFLAQLPQEVRRQASADPRVLRQELARESNAAFQRQFTEMRNEFIKQVGIAATGETSMGEVVKMITGKYLTSKIRPYERWIPPLLALSLYFVLQAFSFLYIALINLFSLIVVGCLRGLRLVAVKRQTAEVEEMVIQA